MRRIDEVFEGFEQNTGRRTTGTPVRRHSHEAGQCEAKIWRKTNRAELNGILSAAKRYAVVTRGQERMAGKTTHGALSHVALEILELFVRLVDHKTGRLDPSIETMMDRLKRSRAAIVNGLAQLRRHGFLDWLRRFVPIEGEGRGPRVRQYSNAYRLALPEAAKRLCRWLMGSPPPDDFAHATAQRAANWTAYVRAHPPYEQPHLTMGADNPLANVLASLGRKVFGVNERESGSQTESPSQLFIYRD